MASNTRFIFVLLVHKSNLLLKMLIFFNLSQVIQLYASRRLMNTNKSLMNVLMNTNESTTPFAIMLIPPFVVRSLKCIITFKGYRKLFLIIVMKIDAE
jgi:hypothetical protein